MAFQIQPVKEFLVRPALPPAISRMSELAYNVLWSWDHTIRSLFRRLDSALWKGCGYNPVLMLGRVPQATLERAASDPRFLAAYRRACERYANYLERSEPPQDRLIAYFSMEYGLVECMPIYSGGLGVLSGDHLKASSDGEIPLVGVGLLYQKGFLQQSLNPDGWQQERNPVNDFYTLPVRPLRDEQGHDRTVSVMLPTGEVRIKIWYMDIGRVKLYLLDTNIPENEPIEHREITDQLYAGDNVTRIRQEIVLGIGGLRALHLLGLKPTVWHMNEGHSAFLAVERMRILIDKQGLSFEEAFEACRSNNVFTTHTSVPAGIDLFDPGLMYEYFGEYCRESSIPFESFLALGRFHPENQQEPFSMAIAAVKTSAFRNAVSCIASAGIAGDVAESLAQVAGLGSSHHFGNQRRASAHLAEWRPGATLRSVSPARLARALPGPQDLGAGGRYSQFGTMGGASAPQTPSGYLRAGTRMAAAAVRAKPRVPNSVACRTFWTRTPSPSVSRADSQLISAPRCCSATSTASNAC